MKLVLVIALGGGLGAVSRHLLNGWVSRLMGADYGVVLEWIGNTFNAVLLLAFLTAAFHHAAAGLQVVIEDYVRDELKRFAAICAVNGLATLLWLGTTLSVLRIAL